MPKTSLIKELHNKLHLVYSGIIPRKRSPECLFIALKELSDELHNDEYMELHIYGIMHEKFRQMILDYNLEKLVKYKGYVRHDECIKQIIKSDVGLVIIPPIEGSETAIPGKIYEYLACDKFILTLADKDSAVARLVISEKLGIVADPRKVEEIKYALKRILEMFKDGSLSKHYSVDIKERYNRINHSKQLSELLLNIVG
jgi:glycosyltransferase involved in cell wall biosynthesis